MTRHGCRAADRRGGVRVSLGSGVQRPPAASRRRWYSGDGGCWLCRKRSRPRGQSWVLAKCSGAEIGVSGRDKRTFSCTDRWIGRRRQAALCTSVIDDLQKQVVDASPGTSSSMAIRSPCLPPSSAIARVCKRKAPPKCGDIAWPHVRWLVLEKR
jgi:hypothetical protein